MDWTGKGATEPLKLDHLPNEVLQGIFIYTQEWTLPLCNKRLNQALTWRDLHLQRRVLREALVDVDGSPRLPTGMLKRRFVNQQLLKQLGIREFCNDHYKCKARLKSPSLLERLPLTERKLQLLVYTIECGLLPHHSKKLIPELIKHHEMQAVQKLVDSDCTYDHRSVLAALNGGHDELAKDLISKTDLNFYNIWDHVLEHNETHAYNFLKAMGSQPPWEVMKKHMNN